MKIRTLTVATAVAALALLGLSAPAWAGTTTEDPAATTEHETGVTGTEAEAVEAEAEAEGESEAEISHVGECVEEAVHEGRDPADCQEAPNPILPEVNEIIWGGSAFLILLAVMWKVALPPIRQGLSDRSERIRSDLERAESARAEAEEVLARYEAQLADARTEAQRIIDDARQTAEALKADLQQRAEAEIAEMRQRARADVEAAKAQAVADLRAEVAGIALGAAEMVVERSLDRETQIQLIENYINQVGSSS